MKLGNLNLVRLASARQRYFVQEYPHLFMTKRRYAPTVWLLIVAPLATTADELWEHRHFNNRDWCRVYHPEGANYNCYKAKTLEAAAAEVRRFVRSDEYKSVLKHLQNGGVFKQGPKGEQIWAK